MREKNCMNKLVNMHRLCNISFFTVYFGGAMVSYLNLYYYYGHIIVCFN